MARIIERRSSGTWWKCLLAFFGGIFFTIALLLGGGFFAATAAPTGTLLGPYASYLTEEFQQKTVLDIIMGIADQSITFNNLGDIAKITPEVPKIFDAINDSFQNAGLNVTINFDELKDEPWATIDVKIIDTFKNGVTLADMLHVNSESERILRYFCYRKNPDGSFDYSEEGRYTLKDFMDDPDFFNNLIDELTIGDVVTPDPSNPNPLLDTLSTFTINDLKDKDKLMDAINDIEVSELFTADQISGNKLLQTICDEGWTISSFTDENNLKGLKINQIVDTEAGTILDAIGDKTIGQLNDADAFDDILVKKIITVDDSSSELVKYLGEKTIGELKDDDLVNGIYISDIFSTEDINGNKVLKALNELPIDPADPERPELTHGCKVGDIGDKVNDLKLEDVMDCSGDNKIVNALKDKKIGELSDSINDLEVGEVFEYYVKPSTGEYYNDSEFNTKLSPVLCKLIGGNPFGHDYPGYQVNAATITIDRTVNNQDYDYIVFNDGTDDKKTDYLKISDFLQNETITVEEQIVAEEVTYVATGSGSVDRDIYCDSFTINLVTPASWSEAYYFVCNKPTKVTGMSNAVDELKLKDVMNIQPGSVFDNNRIKNTSIHDADNVFDVIKEELTLKDVIGNSTSKILKTLEDTKIGSLGSKVDDLSIADVVEYYGPIYDPVSHKDKYYSDSGHTEELSSVLVKLVGGEPSQHPFPGFEAVGNPILINRNIDGQYYDNIVFSDGTNEHSTGSLKIDDYLSYATITINEENIGGDIVYTATGSGYSDRDPNAESFTINVNYPAGWANHYYCICNKPAKINNMTGLFSDLKICNVLTEEQRDNRFLKALPANTKITEIGNAINDLPFVSVFEDMIYDTDSTNTLQSTWKYLLIEKTEPWIEGNPSKDLDPLAGYNCNNYTVSNGLEQMMTNMSDNISKVSLIDLQKDGIADFNDGKAWDDPTGFLQKPIPVLFFTPPAGKTKFGELTLKEFADMIANFS